MDLDAFFASVEELLDPALRGKAIMVGGDPGRRGVVSSASYPARRYGVRSAMPVAQALRLCPHAIVVPAKHGVYGEHSDRVMSILRDIAPLVEQISIDEAFLDITGCERLWGSPEATARLIQQRVLAECQLPVSLGIATSKLVAKIACDLGKPKGLTLVKAGGEREFLAPLAIDRLWGVGRVTGDRLRAVGIQTIGDLAAWSEGHLEKWFGAMGRELHRKAHGLDASSVQVSRERHSISQERTFAEDVDDRALLQRTLLSMSESLGSRLRGRGLVCRTVRVKLRFPDFETFTRQSALDQATDQAEVIHKVACELLARHLPAGRRIRLLGLGVSGLLEEGGYQLQLFDQSDQKRIHLNQAVDGIRDKYGRGAIVRASLLSRARRDQPDEERSEAE